MSETRSATVGDAEVRMVRKGQTWHGVVWHKGTRLAERSGADADSLWQMLLADAATANPRYYGFSGAIARFHDIFAKGFASKAYVSNERQYKIDAKNILDGGARIEAARNGTADIAAIAAAFRKTNLLEPRFEGARVQALLASPDAREFIAAAARFADGDLASGLAAMQPVLKKHDVAKWTAATYLPYLWRPDQHMFLKPEATRDFAARVGLTFDYEAALQPSVYRSLLALAEATEAQIASLAPRDRIDVQSFIWVVGKYDEKDAEKMRLLDGQA